MRSSAAGLISSVWGGETDQGRVIMPLVGTTMIVATLCVKTRKRQERCTLKPHNSSAAALRCERMASRAGPTRSGALLTSAACDTRLWGAGVGAS